MKTYNLELTNTQAYLLKVLLDCSSNDSLKNHIKNPTKHFIHTYDKSLAIELCEYKNSIDGTDIIYDIWNKLDSFDIELPIKE